MSGTSDGAAQSAPPVRAVGAADVLLVMWLTVLATAGAVVAVAYLPWYLGTVPIPLAALLGAVILFLTVQQAYRVTRSIGAAALPAVGWLLASVTLTTYRTLGYGLVIGDWRSLLLVGLGSLAGAAALASCWATGSAAFVGVRGRCRTRRGGVRRQPSRRRGYWRGPSVAMHWFAFR